MSRWLPRLVTGPLIAAAVLLGVWGLTHRGDVGGGLALAAMPTLIVVAARMFRRLGG